MVDFTAFPRVKDINKNATAQILQIPPNFDKVMTPFRMILAGPTMSGKSRFIANILKYRSVIINNKFKKIVYCLPAKGFILHAPYLDHLKDLCADVDFHIIEDMPDIESLSLDQDTDSKLIIFDDLMVKAFNSDDVFTLITQTSHHANISVILTTQNIFYPSKHGKTLMQNCSTIVVHWDGNDVQMLNILSMQMFPKGSNFLHQCFEWMHKNPQIVPVGYVLIDGAPQSLLSRQMRVRTNIFPKHLESPPEPVFFFTD